MLLYLLLLLLLFVENGWAGVLVIALLSPVVAMVVVISVGVWLCGKQGNC